MTPFSDLHYFSTQQLVRVISFKKNRPGCSCPLNKTLHCLHFTQIKSQECRVSQMVCHNPGWSIHPPQNCGLEHSSLWCLHSLHFYFLHIFSQMPANLRGLNGQQILLIQFYLFSCIASWHIFSAFLLSTFHKNISSSRAENISALFIVIYLNTAQQRMNERLNKWMECKLGSAEQGYWAFYKESVWELHLYTLKRLKCLD